MSVYDPYKQKLWEIIEREYDGSRMNVTRWMAMFDVMRDLRLWRRIKLIDLPEASHWTRQTSIVSTEDGMPRGYFEVPYSPTPMLAIEWIEFDPIAESDKHDHSQEIERRLQMVGIPYCCEGSMIRIIGHVRRDAEAK